MRTRVISSLLIATLASVPMASGAASPGRTFACRFARHGTIVIDTREPDATLTIAGRRYLAQGGSYFYQAVDDPGIVIMFQPDMRSWTFRSEASSGCTSRPNRR